MIERHVYLRVYFSGLSSSRVGYRGRLGRLKPTSNFVERCNFGANYDRPTLKKKWSLLRKIFCIRPYHSIHRAFVPVLPILFINCWCQQPQFRFLLTAIISLYCAFVNLVISVWKHLVRIVIFLFYILFFFHAN